MWPWPRREEAGIVPASRQQAAVAAQAEVEQAFVDALLLASTELARAADKALEQRRKGHPHA